MKELVWKKFWIIAQKPDLMVTDFMNVIKLERASLHVNEMIFSLINEAHICVLTS